MRLGLFKCTTSLVLPKLVTSPPCPGELQQHQYRERCSLPPHEPLLCLSHSGNAHWPLVIKVYILEIEIIELMGKWYGKKVWMSQRLPHSFGSTTMLQSLIFKVSYPQDSWLTISKLLFKKEVPVVNHVNESPVFYFVSCNLVCTSCSSKPQLHLSKQNCRFAEQRLWQFHSSPFLMLLCYLSLV